MSEGVKEGKRCGLEISETQMEVSGGDGRRPYPLTGSCSLAGLGLLLHWPEFPQYFSELVCFGFFFVDFFSYLILCHQQGTPFSSTILVIFTDKTILPSRKIRMCL